MTVTTAPVGLSRAPWLRRVLTGAALVGLCTCSIEIDVPIDAKATIPAAGLVDGLLETLDVPGFNQVDLSESLQNQGVTKDQVDSVHLKSMTLTIDAPSGQTFDFLQSITFFAETDGEPKVQIASITKVPAGASTLDLTVNADAELKPYVVAPSMTISSAVQGSAPKQDTSISVHADFGVAAVIPGCK